MLILFMVEKMKILEICPFSAGICGVWARVLSESHEFKKLGYNVRVFSSNIVKGTPETASCEEDNEGIRINRFGAKNSIISKNVFIFNFEKEFREYSPDIVITHLLHPHSFKALWICKKLKIPCYLVTHAPFNVKRPFPLNILTGIYNQINIKPRINDFTKIIAITKWEMPCLKKLGLRKEKIIYIPNGLPDEFFTQKKSKQSETKDVLFLGRIAHVKNLETLIYAAKILPNINFSIVGKAEEEYLKKLNQLIKKEKVSNIKIYPPIKDLRKKIELIDNHRIFVLPSNREAMPQVLIEAMSRGKLVIASKTDGAKEIIQDGKTGFLFDINNSKKLADIINKNIRGNTKIQNNVKKEAKKYAWKTLIKTYLKLFNKK